MPGFGYRSGTRYAFKRGFRDQGRLPLLQYIRPIKCVPALLTPPPLAPPAALSLPPALRARAWRTRQAACPLPPPDPKPPPPLSPPPSLPFRTGDIVEVVVNSMVHKGMPHKTYHGRTGIVFNVAKKAVGVEVRGGCPCLGPCAALPP